MLQKQIYHYLFFFEENKELFGCQKEYLPVRMVVGNQIKDLAVQVHPDDEYGMAHSHMRGKPESEWLLGDGEGTMILGHHAKTKEEFIKLDGLGEKIYDRCGTKLIALIESYLEHENDFKTTEL